MTEHWGRVRMPTRLRRTNRQITKFTVSQITPENKHTLASLHHYSAAGWRTVISPTSVFLHSLPQRITEPSREAPTTYHCEQGEREAEPAEHVYEAVHLLSLLRRVEQAAAGRRTPLHCRVESQLVLGGNQRRQARGGRVKLEVLHRVLQGCGSEPVTTLQRSDSTGCNFTEANMEE